MSNLENLILMDVTLSMPPLPVNLLKAKLISWYVASSDFHDASTNWFWSKQK